MPTLDVTPETKVDPLTFSSGQVALIFLLTALAAFTLGAVFMATSIDEPGWQDKEAMIVKWDDKYWQLEPMELAKK